MMKWLSGVVVAALAACGTESSPPAPPAPATGFVNSPTNGERFAGVTSQTSIPVTGLYHGPSTALTVQIADPTAGGAWVDIGTADVVRGTYATSVGPLDAQQWPQGGVLRLRVIDDDARALPYAAGNDDHLFGTTIVVGSTPTVSSWQSVMPIGTGEETAQYYAVTHAPSTLAAFEDAFGLASDGGAAEAFYFDKTNLALGEDLRCAATTAGGVACVETNYGTFGGTETDAFGELENVANVAAESTFAMVYTPPLDAPNAVTFAVYDPFGQLTTKTGLASADVPLAQTCTTCHGGAAHYDRGSHAATGALFLQIDPLTMDFDPDRLALGFAAQESALYDLQQIVNNAIDLPAARELGEGEWPATGSDVTFDANFIPAAWGNNPHDATLYTQVVAPFCRGCHVANAQIAGGLAFDSPIDFTANAAHILDEVCRANTMPAAPVTAARFFDGAAPGCNETGCQPSDALQRVSASALLVEYLGAAGDDGGACVPPPPQ